MNKTQERIAALSATVLPHTAIVGVMRGHGGLFKDNGKSDFYRVMLEGSFDGDEFGKSSYIRAEVWLPDNWNGIFVGLGNGGMAGGFGYENLKMNVDHGYAVAQTDLGTSRGVSFGIGNPEVWKDFGWRATHWMTASARSIIEAHFGKKPEHSYFVAESTGGEQALSEAQRFPDDYDGIIAGVPANNRVNLHTYFVWTVICATRSDNSALFTSDELNAITSYATEFFKENGRCIHGTDVISHPYMGEGTNERFIAFLREKGEFSDEQLAALKKIYDGPIAPKSGRRIHGGLPIGAERFGMIPTQFNGRHPHFYPFIWALGEPFDARKFDFDRDLDKVTERLACHMNANSPDLSAFRDKGGKLIMYSGLCDATVPYHGAAQYVDRVYERTSGADGFLRYFIVPGKDHSVGGYINNIGGSLPNLKAMLGILRNWREKGVVPDMLVGKHIENGEVKLVFEVPKYTPGSAKCPPACDGFYLEN